MGKGSTKSSDWIERSNLALKQWQQQKEPNNRHWHNIASGGIFGCEKEKGRMGHFLLQASSCPDSLPLSEQMMPVNVSLPNLAHLCLISAPIFHPSLSPPFIPSRLFCSFLLPPPQSPIFRPRHKSLATHVRGPVGQTISPLLLMEKSGPE
jgi:hypothetical protein